jgi:S-(hydroxymethyl)glutathione dehydrogenase/alcohol dehydrogenase
MSWMARALVSRRKGAPPSVETVRVEPPSAGEITMKVAACGVCHSDLSVMTGVLPMPHPIILGHEAAGVVVEVGAGVEGIAAGDPVVSSFVSVCGHCRYCAQGRPNLCDQTGQAAHGVPGGGVRTFDAEGAPLNVFSGCGAMAEYATLSASNAVRIASGFPLEHAALVSCGAMTGVGAVFNRARVQPGSDVMVVGVGGVGINVIQAAAICGAARIIAVDLDEQKRDVALRFGATHFHRSDDPMLVEQLRELTLGGPDYAFECVGRSDTVELAFRAIRKGGMAVVVGVAPRSDRAALRLASFTFEEKTLTGSYFGSCRPQRDVPALIELARRGRLDLEGLISRRYGIEEAPRAFEDLRAGRNARGLIVFP